MLQTARTVAVVGPSPWHASRQVTKETTITDTAEVSEETKTLSKLEARGLLAFGLAASSGTFGLLDSAGKFGSRVQGNSK